MQRLLVPLFMLAILLSACKTTVISDEDRALPNEGSQASSEMMMDDSSEKSEMMDDMEDSSDDSSEMMMDDSSSEDESDDMEEKMTYTADMNQSFIAFVGTKGSAVSHEGTFNGYEVTVEKEGGKPTSVMVTINMSTLVTDSGGLTKHLLAEDFFNAATHTTASFKSTSIASAGGDSYNVTGNMTINGVTKVETLSATITDSYLTANHTLNRMDYSVGLPPEGVKAIDVEVPLEVKIVFKK